MCNDSVVASECPTGESCRVDSTERLEFEAGPDANFRKEQMGNAIETLNCPTCGAPTASNATKCDHCGARLATVACPSCFGLVFQGAKFCSHCGAAVDRTELQTDVPRPCPCCRVQLKGVRLGKVTLLECAKCEGVWTDAETFDQICTDQEEQAAVLGVATHLPADDANSVEDFRYRPCPVCSKLMNRVNFAHCSHVIVDVCREHGTWFDKDELRRIVEFIRGGGLDKARKMEIASLELKRQQLESARDSGKWDPDLLLGGGMGWSGSRADSLGLGISAAASVLRNLFR